MDLLSLEERLALLVGLPHVINQVLWELSSNADWLTLSRSDGVLEGKPGPKEVGTYWINITVADGEGGFDHLNFTLTVLSGKDGEKDKETKIPTLYVAVGAILVLIVLI